MRRAVTQVTGLVRVTSITDGREHAVTIDAMEDAQSTGRLAAACGSLVVLAPIVAPPGRHCPDCVSTTRAARRRRGPGRHTRPGRWAWLTRRTRHT